jgi:hypothetical protein
MFEPLSKRYLRRPIPLVIRGRCVCPHIGFTEVGRPELVSVRDSCLARNNTYGAGGGVALPKAGPARDSPST